MVRNSDSIGELEAAEFNDGVSNYGDNYCIDIGEATEFNNKINNELEWTLKWYQVDNGNTFDHELQ